MSCTASKPSTPKSIDPVPRFLEHTCHWPGCGRAVAPKFWGCSECWFRLPKYLRDKIWAAYVPGQEVTKTPSKEYVRVAREVQAWIRDNWPNLFRT